MKKLFDFLEKKMLSWSASLRKIDQPENTPEIIKKLKQAFPDASPLREFFTEEKLLDGLVVGQSSFLYQRLGAVLFIIPVLYMVVSLPIIVSVSVNFLTFVLCFSLSTGLGFFWYVLALHASKLGDQLAWREKEPSRADHDLFLLALQRSPLSVVQKKAVLEYLTLPVNAEWFRKCLPALEKLATDYFSPQDFKEMLKSPTEENRTLIIHAPEEDMLAPTSLILRKDVK